MLHVVIVCLLAVVATGGVATPPIPGGLGGTSTPPIPYVEGGDGVGEIDYWTRVAVSLGLDDVVIAVTPAGVFALTQTGAVGPFADSPPGTQSVTVGSGACWEFPDETGTGPAWVTPTGSGQTLSAAVSDYKALVGYLVDIGAQKVPGSNCSGY